MTVTCEVRSVDSTLLATFNDPAPGPVAKQEHAVGSASVAWKAYSAVESEVCSTLSDGAGGLHTWDTADVELWIWRDTTLVHRGPIYRHTINAKGEVTTHAHDCVGYLWRLDQGRAEPVNWSPAGEFDASLTGWTANGATITANATDAYGSEDYAMDITGDGSPFAYSDTMGSIGFVGVVHISVPVLWEGAAWADGQFPGVGIVYHQTSPPGAGTWSVVGDPVPLTVDSGVNPRNGAWFLATTEVQRHPDVDNRYLLALAQWGTTTRIGRWRTVQAQNISARSGNDVATFAAALFDYLIDDYLTGWTRSVDEVGFDLFADWRSDDFDHPEIPALLRMLEDYGTWWVDQPDDDHPVLRFAATRGSASGITLAVGTAPNLEVDVDASDATTEAIFLADGQDGPSRDEGSAVVDPLPGALLTRVEKGPAGFVGGDLDVLAGLFLLGDGKRVTRWTGSPPAPSGESRGARAGVLDVGDTATATLEAGVIDLSDTVRVVGWEWTPASGGFTVDWEAA